MLVEKEPTVMNEEEEEDWVNDDDAFLVEPDEVQGANVPVQAAESAAATEVTPVVQIEDAEEEENGSSLVETGSKSTVEESTTPPDPEKTTVATPSVEHPYTTTGVDDVLAAAVENTLNIKKAPDTTAPSTTADLMEPPREKKEKPSYWKLAGRAIKKTKAGKAVLNGFRDGLDGTVRTFGIGVGEINICVDEKIYRPEETVTGIVTMNLTKPVSGSRLEMSLVGERKSFSLGEQPMVHIVQEMEGAQVFSCEGQFPFEVVIPRVRRKQATDGTAAAPSSAPIEWSLTATLVIPGQLVHLSTTIRIDVADE